VTSPRLLLAAGLAAGLLLVSSCGDDDSTPTPADRVAFDRSVVEVADALAAGTVPAELVVELCDRADDFPSVSVVAPVAAVIAEECK
jgi:hypothetical protein